MFFVILQIEISGLRSQKSALEDRLGQLTEDFTVVHARADSVVEMCRQLEKSRDEAVECQKKLRSDLKASQKFNASSYRSDGSAINNGQLVLRAQSSGTEKANKTQKSSKNFTTVKNFQLSHFPHFPLLLCVFC